MTRFRQLVTAAALLTLGGLGSAAAPAQTPPPGGRVLDGIAAVVNGHPILESEVRVAALFARFSAGLEVHTPAWTAPLSAAEESTALRHLIDEELLNDAEQSEGYAEASAALDKKVAAQWTHLRQLAGGPAALQTQLRAYDLNAAGVERLLRRQVALLSFLDERFGATVVVSGKQVEDYYEHVLTPAARSRHRSMAPLSEVRGTIEAILRQQEQARLEQQWLQELRSSAQVQILMGAAVVEGKPTA